MGCYQNMEGAVTLKIELATDKVPKHASGESGDSFEVVERPQGGITAILADGQGSGPSAKITSNTVAAKAASLVSDGTRDGAVSRAAHDFLYAQKRGRVSSTLTMVSCDLATDTLVISRNSNCPVIVKTEDEIKVLDEPVKPIGFHYFVKPTIDELPITPGTVVISFSDGIFHAGRKFGNQVAVDDIIEMLETNNQQDGIYELSQDILSLAVDRDRNRPQDDMSVLVLGLFAGEYQHKPRQLRVMYTY